MSRLAKVSAALLLLAAASAHAQVLTANTEIKFTWSFTPDLTTEGAPNVVWNNDGTYHTGGPDSITDVSGDTTLSYQLDANALSGSFDVTYTSTGGSTQLASGVQQILHTGGKAGKVTLTYQVNSTLTGTAAPGDHPWGEVLLSGYVPNGWVEGIDIDFPNGSIGTFLPLNAVEQGGWVFDVPALNQSSDKYTFGVSSSQWFQAADPVPEPETWALLGLGLVATAARMRRRK